MANTGFTRCTSFGAQIVLGWLLSKEDFGIYALAISMAAFGSLLRDAGVRQILISRQKEYAALLGPVFWMALAFNTVAGVLLAVAAPVVAAGYGEPALIGLVLVIAFAQPLATPGAILASRLQIDMRFRALGAIQVGSALLRYGGAVVFALAGFGPISFVLPLPLVAVYEGAVGWLLTRERPWARSPRISLWEPLFVQARWVLVGSFAVALLNLGPNLAIGLFAQTALVGAYFFAFQIIIQLGMLFSTNVGQVLLAALSKIATERERKREAVVRSLRQLMMVGAPASMGLAVTFRPLELLIWQGKWATAAHAVQALGVFYALALLPSVAVSAQHARGDFRAAAAGLLVLAGVSVSAASVGAAAIGTTFGIALAVALGRGTASLMHVVIVLRPLGVTWRRICAGVLPAWLASVIGGALALGMDVLLVHWHPGIRLIAAGTIFAMSYLVLARLLLLDDLIDAVSHLRGKPRLLAERMLMLPLPRLGAVTPPSDGSAEAPVGPAPATTPERSPFAP